MWVITEIMQHEKERANKDNLSVVGVLRKIDTSSILFFLGILLAINALESLGILNMLSASLDRLFPNRDIVATIIGVMSAVIDNVPLVAASIGMYDLPMDAKMWHFIAFSAGTGGSMLIIGSAAGVAAMGMEKINFIWYLKNIAWLAAIGFLTGCFAVYIMHQVLGG